MVCMHFTTFLLAIHYIYILQFLNIKHKEPQGFVSLLIFLKTVRI